MDVFVGRKRKISKEESEYYLRKKTKDYLTKKLRVFKKENEGFFRKKTKDFYEGFSRN